MFGSRRKHAKAIHTTSVAINNEDISGDTEEHLSHNSCKRQNKSDAQATGIAMVKKELNIALHENKRLKDLLNPEKIVEAMTKVVSAMTMKEHLKTPQGTQYNGASNYVGRQQ